VLLCLVRPVDSREAAMSEMGSVTEWIERLKGADPQAAQAIWERYAERLARLARSKLPPSRRRVADEEDVVISAFDAVIRGIQEGRFAKLNDRHDLWQVMVMLTERKAIAQLRRDKARKRGGGKVRGESALGRPESASSGPAGMAGVPDLAPTPEFAAQMSEQVWRLFDRLGEDMLVKIVIAKLEGCTNQEVADKCNMGLRSVERKLKRIRQIWEDEPKS
jgi:DNA-directed RNA polymerase specialized sigma24 family protein